MQRTEGHLLGGRLRYAQPLHGYRTGIEPVLLAAAIPAQPGQRVLEAGTGAGAALLCLAARVPGVHGTGVEIDPAMAELAQYNFAANGMDLLSALAADITQAALRGGFHHAFANPPWHGAASTASPEPRRRLAKQESGPGLAAWVGALCRAVRPGGTVTLILPPGLANAAGAGLRAAGLRVRVMPFWPKAGRPPKLVLVAGRPGLADFTVAGLVLHREDGSYSEAAEAVLRGGAALSLA